MKEIAIENLKQLNDLLLKIEKADYTFSQKILSGATIGQHIRHILEFYQIFFNSLEGLEICYDKRERNILLETDVDYTQRVVQKLIFKVNKLKEDTILEFKTDFNTEVKCAPIKTSAYRELAYCIEHSIHHQAIIKSGLLAMQKEMLVDDNFGVAYSTIKYRNNTCAQ